MLVQLIHKGREVHFECHSNLPGTLEGGLSLTLKYLGDVGYRQAGTEGDSTEVNESVNKEDGLGGRLIHQAGHRGRELSVLTHILMIS